MTRIAPVKLAHSSKSLWFDALDYELSKNQAVVVTTARGVEFGTIADDVFEATKEQLAQLKSPLKPIKRIATDQDIEQAQRMEALSEEALPIFREIAAQTNEDMHPISVEYLLEGDKAIFYFEAEDRVDFRDLVRKLASHFHVRVDMRQVGVRDEARLLGGLGHCGQELCCKRMGGEFNPVSIRMAKAQDLSLNPQKISGLCGRLMCCLRYEFDAYKDFKSRAPKQNAMIQTPDGPAKVVSLDVPREIITLKLEDDKTIKIALSDFDAPKEDSSRPQSVGKEAWERAKEAISMGSLSATTFLTSQFTQNDKVGNATAVHNEASNKPMPSKKQPRKRTGKQTVEANHSEASAKPRKRRRSTKVGSANVESASQKQLSAEVQTRSYNVAEGEPVQQVQDRTRRKRRRSHSGKAAATSAVQTNVQQSSQDIGEKVQSPRPGQKSSGLRQVHNAAQKKAEQGSDVQSQSAKQKNARRRRRGGTHKPDSASANANVYAGASASTNAAQATSGAKPKQGSEHRKTRRRSHKSTSGATSGSESNPSQHDA